MSIHRMLAVSEFMRTLRLRVGGAFSGYVLKMAIRSIEESSDFNIRIPE